MHCMHDIVTGAEVPKTWNLDSSLSHSYNLSEKQTFTTLFGGTKLKGIIMPIPKWVPKLELFLNFL